MSGDICYRCKRVMDAPDLQEMLDRESDWRRNWADSFEAVAEERVLICADCADELDELEE